ncbi:MAG: chromosome segregation protein, partial [Deltaproteobacteria bacterium]|nr:chromosome segregation protein [Deltaproteobacteria bacterium]
HLAMSAERDAARTELAGLEDALTACRSGVSALDADREEARLTQAERERLLADLREEHARRKEEAARREAEWNGLLAQAEHFRRTISETGREMETLAAEIEDLDARLGRADGDTLLRREELDRARREWEEAKVALAAAREEHRSVQDRADRASSDLMVRVTQHSGAQHGAEALSQRIEEGERGLARLSERIAEAAAAVERASAESGSASAAEMAAREALSAAERSWNETGELLAGTVSRLDAAVDGSRLAEGELQSAESRLTTLSRVHEQHDWTSSGVRAVLHHFRNGGVRESAADGIFGIMGDLIETDAEYEKAVEAVLGERMQSVVVRDHADGLSAIHYLKESGEGRGAFVPVGLRIREERLGYVGEEGVVGPLTSVVQAPPEYGELVRGLLGGTLLVRNLDTALRLWNRNGVWNSYVTLDGEVVTADGILIGGGRGKAREAADGEHAAAEAGILARRREIRELSREIGELRLRRERRLEEEEAVRRARTELEERRAEMFRAREAASSAHAAASKAKAVIEETLSQARAQLDERTQEERYLRGELGRMADELTASIAVARETGQARGEEEERSRALLAEVEEKRRHLEECRERAHAAEIAYNALEEKDRAAAALLASITCPSTPRCAPAGTRSNRRRPACPACRTGSTPAWPTWPWPLPACRGSRRSFAGPGRGNPKRWSASPRNACGCRRSRWTSRRSARCSTSATRSAWRSSRPSSRKKGPPGGARTSPGSRRGRKRAGSGCPRWER